MPGSPGSGKGNGMVIVGSPTDGTVGSTDVIGGNSGGVVTGAVGFGAGTPADGGGTGGS